MSLTNEIFRLNDTSEYVIAKCNGTKLQNLDKFMEKYRIMGVSNTIPNIISTMGDKYRIENEDDYNTFLRMLNEINNKPTNFSEIQCLKSSGIYIELNIAEADIELVKTHMGRLVKSACKVTYDILDLDECCEYKLYITTAANGIAIIAPEICTNASVRHHICTALENALPQKLKSLCTINLQSYIAPVMLLGGRGRECIFVYKFYKDEDGCIECESHSTKATPINILDTSIKCRKLEHIITAKKSIPELVITRDAQTLANLEIENNCTPNAQILKGLLEILDAKYSTDRYYWARVVRALAGISPKNKRLAQWFSSRTSCPFFNDFESEWNTAAKKDDVLRIGSIYKWAKESNHTAYKLVKDRIIYDIVERAAFEYHGIILDKIVANILYCIFAKKYVTILEDDNKPRWITFITKSEDPAELFKWKKLKSPTAMRNYISQKLPIIYNRLITNIDIRIKSEPDEKCAKYLSEILKNVRGSKLSLQKHVFISNIEKGATDIFEDNHFEKLLDSYKNVIGVGNGILVMGEKCRFIADRHDYYISRYTKTQYIPYDENNSKVKELMNAFKDMIPEDDALEFALLHAATALDFNVHNVLFAGFGSGSNGKSSWAQFIKNVMGQYASVFRMNLLTDAPEPSDKPNSARMMLKNKTWGFFDETDKCKKLNTNSLKLLVGDGEQSSRNLNKPEDVFRNTASFFASSNYEFTIDDTDHGTWRRFLVYYFKMRFCEHPTGKFERKVNPDFIKKWIFDSEYLSAMLSIMVHYYEILQTKYNGNLMSAVGPTIKRYTQEYRNKQDTINRFITEEIIEAENVELESIDIARAYISWYKCHITDAKHLNVRDVVAEIDNSALGSKLVHVEGSAYKKIKGYGIKSSRTIQNATLML